MSQPKQHISLLRFQQLIRDRLEDAMPLPCWITAEISELKVNYSGHCYLELVEKGGDNGVPCAKASAVIWRSKFGMLSSYFRSETGAELAEGMNVLLKVSVNYHELYGLSFVVSDIDPLYTVGDMERQRMETIRRLQQDGVFDMNRSLGMPAVVQRIAVVSSRNAAGYQDFMNELALSGYAFDVKLFDSFMQGHGAEASVIEALEKVLEEVEKYDAVVVIRGGGAQSDLAAFDSYRLCCHIAQFPVPVLTGIGHDKDESVADLVACLSLKTPTAVATWLVNGLAEFEEWLDTARTTVASSAVAMIEDEQRFLHNAALEISNIAGTATHRMEMRLEKLLFEIMRRQETYMVKADSLLTEYRRRLRTTADAILTREKSRLRHAAELAAGRSPDKILSLGFAIVRSQGKAVADSSVLTVGEALDIRLSKGSVIAAVNEIKE